MKLSLAWIFDHIDAHWQDHDINFIMAKFNQVTAEIEHFYPINYNLDQFYLAQLPTLTSPNALIAELQKDIKINERKDAVDILLPHATNRSFLVKKTGDSFAWATLADFGVDKDGLVPSLDASEEDLKGGWRAKFEHRDIIIEVDNKSITHRPDMWGHRGFAREIASFLKLQFLPAEKFLAQHSRNLFDKKSEVTKSQPFIVDNQAPQACRKFNGLYFPSIENKPSNIFITSRLLKVGGRPINGIVDLTNYVTLDLAQPVHAYDAHKIIDKKVIIRMAKEEEKLLLLDGNELTLTAQDVVIADGKKPMCLAGVKGGMHDSVTAKTTSIFFESATFDASFVRHSALHHKTRTDSSARFEKTLDQNQAIEAVLRFIQLTKQCGVAATYADAIISVGADAHEEVIKISHDFLEKQSGLSFSSETIVELLTRLEFKVTKSSSTPLMYAVTVPTFRSSKDVKIKEDILEEVVRSYGFEKIPLQLPSMHKVAFDLTPLRRLRKIRQFLAYSVGMIEQQNYSMFDEQTITSLGLQEQETLSIINPVSENYKRLATSLVPGLLKNIKENYVHHDSLFFFEIGRIWPCTQKKLSEKKSICGIFFEKRKQVDFYDAKQHLMNLFAMLGFDLSKLTWEKVTHSCKPWYRPYQSVTIHYHGVKVARAGKIDPTFIHKLDVLPESDAFIFELDGNFLLHEELLPKQYANVSRFQETFFDISILVPLASMSAGIQEQLLIISPLVTNVQLIDFFEKESWTDVRSLTFRVWLNHHERTLEKDEIELVRKSAIATVEKIGGQIRS